MERYVIVALLKGESLQFHEQLVKKICTTFEVQPQKLPGHLTLKAPFETHHIAEIETLLTHFTQNKKSTPITLQNYGFFRKNVVYMKVLPSDSFLALYEDFIKEIRTCTWLEWKNHEGEDRTFHCTLVSKRIEGKFNKIWDYVQQHPYEFTFPVDNITILRWEKHKWETYKSFPLLS